MKTSARFQVTEYDLAATLTSGQAFRWQQHGHSWRGVIGQRWVELRPSRTFIEATTNSDPHDWSWLRRYLQLDVSLDAILARFPADPVLSHAVSCCRGLRLLQQDPWECLASFILSSTKQIIQIQQVIHALCERFGQKVATPAGVPIAFAFPTPERLATVLESDLRACKMGFRAPYLLKTAQLVASNTVDLQALYKLPLAQAREALIQFPGVGRKIADCVLLFAYGFPTAFPIDVWVLRALRDLYFSRRKVKPARLRHFADTHFGPFAGYAQQYLFHYVRTRKLRHPA